MAVRSSSRKQGSTLIALLSILPFQASHEHEEVTWHGLLQELLVHGPELLPDVVLGLSIQNRSIRPWLSCHLDLPPPAIIPVCDFSRWPVVLNGVREQELLGPVRP